MYTWKKDPPKIPLMTRDQEHCTMISTDGEDVSKFGNQRGVKRAITLATGVHAEVKVNGPVLQGSVPD
jgi:hypothetical protein